MNENETIAQKAFELFQKSIQTNELALARLYLLNAVTHNPKQEYIESYVTLIEKYPAKERYNIVDQVSNILSVAALQGSPENIPTILTVQEKLAKMAETSYSPPEQVEQKRNLLAEFHSKYAWEMLKDSDKLEDVELIKARNITMQTIIDSGELSATDQEIFEKEFERSLGYMEWLNKKEQIDANLDFIQKNLEQDNPSVLQVEAKCKESHMLIEHLCLLALPEELKKTGLQIKVNDLNKSLLVQEQRLAEVIAEPTLIKLKQEAEEICQRQLSPSNGDYPEYYFNVGKGYRTCNIRDVKKFLAKVSSFASTTTSEKISESISNIIKEVSEFGRQSEISRYAAYQEYCAKICADAIHKFHDVTWVWEKDAQKILEKCKIAKIDESLLCPECAELYHSARGMLQDKLDKEDSRINFQVSCVTSEKIRLESF